PSQLSCKTATLFYLRIVISRGELLMAKRLDLKIIRQQEQQQWLVQNSVGLNSRAQHGRPPRPHPLSLWILPWRGMPGNRDRRTQLRCPSPVKMGPFRSAKLQRQYRLQAHLLRTFHTPFGIITIHKNSET